MIAWLLTLLLMTQLGVRDTPVARGSGGTISGIVTSEQSPYAPVRHARVNLNGTSHETMITGDDGRFVFTGLPAGRYRVSAEKPGFATTSFGQRPGFDIDVPIALADGQQLSTIVIRLARGGVISGTLMGSSGEPVSRVTVTAGRRLPMEDNRLNNVMSIVQTVSNDDGAFRLFGLPDGDYVVTAWPTLSKDGGAFYPRTSYPGVASMSEAQVITVHSGDERVGIDILLRASLPASVSGIVLDRDGRPFSGQRVELTPAGSTLGLPSELPGGRMTTSTDGQGDFVFEGVAPGTWIVTCDRGIGESVSRTRSSEPAMWSRTDVTVDGRDITGVVLALHPAAPVSGRVLLDSLSTGTPTFRVTLASELGSLISKGTALTQPDGTWVISGLPPGRYSLLMSETGRAEIADGWILQSATVQGRDVRHAAFDINTDPVTDVTLTFTDKLGTARGTITDAAGVPVTDLDVMVFATDDAMQRLYPTALGTPDTNGAWSVSELMPGNYLVAVVANATSVARNSADFTAQLRASAAPIVVTAGKTTVINLRTGG